MPAIVVKDFNWRQSFDTVIISVNLHGYKKIDFFVMGNYAKASYPPFLLELFLWSEVIDEESQCIVDGEKAIISLRKKEQVMWPNLEMGNLTKAIKCKRRNLAIEEAQKVAEERVKKKDEKLHELQQKAVKAQINLDTATINKIDALKNAHRNEAMKELEEWRVNSEIPILRDSLNELQENRKAYRGPLKWFVDEDNRVKSRELSEEEVLSGQETGKQSSELKKLEWKELMDETNEQSSEMEKVAQEQRKQGNTNVEEQTITEPETTKIPSSSFYSPSGVKEHSLTDDRTASNDNKCAMKKITKIDSSDSSSCEEEEDAYSKERKRKEMLIDKIISGKPLMTNKIFDEPSGYVPLPRKTGKISVTFSERAFPTPARESRQLEEQEWLEKQAEARRQTGFYAKDLKPEEQDPIWLKDKGDEFYKAKNYLAAVSAYSHGIKLSPKMASLYVNRSAAQYSLGNYRRCTEDTSTALELMVPKCEGNRESRAKCHARRGAALCKLSAPQHGIPELEEALKLVPNDEAIKRDLAQAKQFFNVREE
ncbi:dynein axonemal assembly factor 4-like [Prorops nasuta]|uniref:dynein axonemal assembly factor 4-like n=1 Tax=Prorops nasuta TaxID=863751 RepID=UPI0034CF03D1